MERILNTGFRFQAPAPQGPPLGRERVFSGFEPSRSVHPSSDGLQPNSDDLHPRAMASNRWPPI